MSFATVRPICPAPKTAAACDNCRSRKLRCLPSKIPGTCERCVAASAKCITIRVRGVGGRKRIEKDARKSNGREAGKSTAASSSIFSAILNSVSTKKHSQEPRSISFTEHHRSMLDRHFPEPLFSSSGSPTWESEVNTNPEADQGIESNTSHQLNNAVAETYLSMFRERWDYFPFVHLPDELDLTSTLRCRPFLAFAILCVMSGDRPEIQRSLDTEFRRAVNEKVIVNSENSFDILQGLLVYLAWFPLHINPRKGRLHQMLGTAANMIKDLGYDRPPDLNHPVPENELQGMKMAYLGCFCLCTNYSLPPIRPSVLFWTPYLESCLLEISAVPDSKLCMVSSILAKLHMMEFETGGTIQASQGSSGLRDRFRMLSSHLAPELWQKLNIRLFEQFLTMRISVTSSLNPDQALDTLKDSSHAVQAIKSIFDSFLNLDVGHYKRFSMIEWNLLVRTIISIFELVASALSQPILDTTQIGQLSSFAPCLERIRYQMSQFSVLTTDIFGLFDSVLQVVQHKYESMSNQLLVVNDRATSRWSQYRHMASLCPVANGSLKNTAHGVTLNTEYSVFESLLQGIDWDSPGSS